MRKILLTGVAVAVGAVRIQVPSKLNLSILIPGRRIASGKRNKNEGHAGIL